MCCLSQSGKIHRPIILLHRMWMYNFLLQMTESSVASPVTKLYRSPTIPQQPENQGHMEAFHEMPKVPALRGMYGQYN
jgi:hypothetical protein